MRSLGNRPENRPIFIAALEDPFHAVRTLALEKLNVSANDKALVLRIQEMVEEDAHSEVRARALRTLETVGNVDILSFTSATLQNDRAFKPIAAALEILNRKDKESALAEAMKLKNLSTTQLHLSLARIFSQSGDPAHLDFFTERMATTSISTIFQFYEDYFNLIKVQSPEVMMEQSTELFKVATNNQLSMYYRFLATHTLARIRGELTGDSLQLRKSISDMIEAVKANETDETLKRRYEMY